MKKQTKLCLGLATLLLALATYAVSPASMVLVPAGKNQGKDSDFGKYELEVESFYIDSTEVTKVLWDDVYEWAIKNGYRFDNRGRGSTENAPVLEVSWYDCAKWCNARSEKEGRAACYLLKGLIYREGRGVIDCDYGADGYRLPTSTEWEYAARGGLRGMRFPWGDKINNENAHYVTAHGSRSCPSYDKGEPDEMERNTVPHERERKYPSAVANFPANNFGVYDMAGNAREWCDNDLFTLHRSIRDGMAATQARCGYAEYIFPDYTGKRLGFRTVRAPPTASLDSSNRVSLSNDEDLQGAAFMSPVDFPVSISSRKSTSEGELKGYMSGGITQNNRVADFENESRFYVISLRNQSQVPICNIDLSYNVYYQQAIPGSTESAQKYSRNRTVSFTQVDPGEEVRVSVPAVTISEYKAYFRFGQWQNAAPNDCEGDFRGIVINVHKKSAGGKLLSRRESQGLKRGDDLSSYRSESVGSYKDQVWVMGQR